MKDTKNKYRYYNFPVAMLSLFSEGKETEMLAKIFVYSVYSMALKNKIEDEAIAVRVALEFFGFEQREDYEDFILENGEALIDEYSEANLFVGLKQSIQQDYFFNSEFKKERDWIKLLAFLGVKSILQNQPHKRITYEQIWSRMSGSNVNIHEFPDRIGKFYTKTRRKNIINSLCLDWGLKKYSTRTRGMYMSFTKSLKYLAKVALSNTENHRRKELAKQQKEARDEARREASIIQINQPKKEYKGKYKSN